MARVLASAVAVLVLALLGASGGAARDAQEVKLFGTVGPDMELALEDAQGNPVTKLDPGPYEIEVRDRSAFHSFHLQGPGVNERTAVEFTGEVTWRVTLQDGVYTFFCDVHPTSMRGQLTAGTPPTTTPPASGGSLTPKTRLVLTSGPSPVITLRTSTGKAVRTLTVGTYTVTVRDRSGTHDARLVAPGFDRRTAPLAYTGTQTWRVRLARPGTLRFLCDAHPSQMRGSARIVR